MAQHIVICKYCGQKFNRDKEPCVAIGGRRYAHQKCAEQQQKEQEEEKENLTDDQKLNNYIIEKYQLEYVSPRIKKQIKDYETLYHYTSNGILKTLMWWFDVKGNTIDKANGGIGIVPYIYDEAKEYYYRLYLSKKASQNIDEQALKPIVKEITIESPRTKTKTHQFFDMRG